MGIAVSPQDGTDAMGLLNGAEMAMHRAKKQGRNTLAFYTQSIQEEILSQRQIERDIETALEQGQFELLYRPQVRLADHRIEAVEAVLRWKHPARGLLNPSEFLAVAEKSGSVVPLGLWALEEACRQLRRWEGAGVPVPRVTLSVAAAQLQQSGFHEAVRNVLQAHSMEAGLIELELAERFLMADTDGMLEALYALKNTGVRLAIDDFGSGLSNLGSLRRLPLDVLKIDGSIVSSLDSSEDAQIVCSGILSFARSFLLDVVAKGIVSARQEGFLTRHDCLYGQGDFFSAPVEAERIGPMLAQRGAQAARRRRATARRIATKAG